ncbi:MAG: hypothetical protein Phog2KO_26350 [Phototrophicaceae bacterium]
MTTPLYHDNVPEIEVHCRTIHPSLLPYLLNVTFEKLSPDEARRIVAGNADRVIGDFIQKARNEGDIK